MPEDAELAPAVIAGLSFDSFRPPNGLIEPSALTLKRYGLSVLDWYMLAQGQKWVCAICGKLPPSGRLVIDHYHEKGWKKKTPGERVKAVRGLLCFSDNRRHLQRGMTADKARTIARYLDAYDAWRKKLDANR